MRVPALEYKIPSPAYRYSCSGRDELIDSTRIYSRSERPKETSSKSHLSTQIDGKTINPPQKTIDTPSQGLREGTPLFAWGRLWPSPAKRGLDQPATPRGRSSTGISGDMGCAESKPEHIDHGLARKSQISKQHWAKAVLGLSSEDVLIKCFAGWVQFVKVEKKERLEREAINAKIKAKEKANPHEAAASFRGTFATKSIFGANKAENAHDVRRVASKSTTDLLAKVNNEIADRKASLFARRQAKAKVSWAKLRVVARFGGLANSVARAGYKPGGDANLDFGGVTELDSRNSYRRPSDGFNAPEKESGRESTSPKSPIYDRQSKIGMPTPQVQNKEGEDLDELSTWTQPGDDSADSSSPKTPVAAPPAAAAPSATAAAPPAAAATSAPSKAPAAARDLPASPDANPAAAEPFVAASKKTSLPDSSPLPKPGPEWPDPSGAAEKAKAAGPQRPSKFANI